MKIDNDPIWFWKTNRMRTELHISGSFIYNAIFTLDQMETLYYEEECFEFLYNASVGIERLLKIAIVLTENHAIEEQEKFEESLITHNTLELINRLKKHHEINLDKPHNKFLSLMGKFYKSVRYSRFSLQSVYDKPQDKYGLISFLNEALYIEIKTEIMNLTPVDSRIRKFMGKIIGKITTQLYEIICKEAHRNDTATDEVSYSSKASKIFYAKEFDFEKERIAQREAFLYLIKSKLNDEIQHFIDNIPTIGIGELNTNKYIKTLFTYEKDRMVLDEVESVYEDDKPDMKRLEELSVLGSDIDFDAFGCSSLEEE